MLGQISHSERGGVLVRKMTTERAERPRYDGQRIDQVDQPGRAGRDRVLGQEGDIVAIRDLHR